MTEQSKIPTPGEARGKGKSLIERAEGMFGQDAFTPAPVPRELRREIAPPDIEDRRPDLVPDTPVAARPEPATAPAPAPAPAPATEPTRFASTRYSVDREALRQNGMIVPGAPVSALVEEFRIVKRQILLAARATNRLDGNANAQRVLVSSPLPGEGKTFCAVNLALAIAAEKDSEVLLVDADFAKPSILEVLGLPKGPGLMDALSNPSIRVEDCVLATDIPGLFVLPAGNRTNSDSEYLASRRTAEVLDRLTRGAPDRMVIFDSPPALAASPAAELAKYVGQTVVVAKADSTGQSALEDALSLLSTCPDIKLLLNAANFSPSGRKFGTYYGSAE